MKYKKGDTFIYYYKGMHIKWKIIQETHYNKFYDYIVKAYEGQYCVREGNFTEERLEYLMQKIENSIDRKIIKRLDK